MSEATGPVHWDKLYEPLLERTHERHTRLDVKACKVLLKVCLLVRTATPNVHELEEQERGNDHAEVCAGDVWTSGEKRHYHYGLCCSQSHL